MSFLEIKKINNFEYVNVKDSINFLIITKDNYMILACQNRFIGKVHNLFGGYIENDENSEQALYRELKEETNLDRFDIEKIETIYKDKYVSIGYSTEKNTNYLLYLKYTLQEIKNKLICNDKKEDINFKIFKINNENLSMLMNNIEGLKMFISLKELQNHEN